MNNNNSLCKKSERERERDDDDDGNFSVHTINVCLFSLGPAFVGSACSVQIHYRIQ
jgi:hypothetical protein